MVMVDDATTAEGGASILDCAAALGADSGPLRQEMPTLGDLLSLFRLLLQTRLLDSEHLGWRHRCSARGPGCWQCHLELLFFVHELRRLLGRRARLEVEDVREVCALEVVPSIGRRLAGGR